MSHITEIKVKVTDLDALKEAAEQLGLEFMEGQTTHRWYGQFVNDSEEGKRFARERSVDEMGKCDHALRVKGDATGHEIGVIKAQDGDGYALVYDSWGPGKQLEAVAGQGLTKLKREYAVEVATKRARRKLGPAGWELDREDLPNGRVRLRLRKR